MKLENSLFVLLVCTILDKNRSTPNVEIRIAGHHVNFHNLGIFTTA
jgi:hypothetical protein